MLCVSAQALSRGITDGQCFRSVCGGIDDSHFELNW